MLKTYKEIKEELLKLETINEVTYNSTRKMITIIPKQNISFLCYDEIMQDKNNDYVEATGVYSIGGREFRKVNGSNFNTQIYEMTIKEITE